MAFLDESGSQSDRRWYRSWGEARIARVLDHQGIPYCYEHPVAVIDRGKTRVWYPDFSLPSLGILIEYYGRLNDPSYAAGMARKQNVYEQNNLTVLPITPDKLRDKWSTQLVDRIEGILFERLEAFRDGRARRASGLHSSGFR